LANATVRSIASAALTLGIGAVGGMALKAFDAPVPFMLGSFLACTVAALLRLPVRLPAWARLFAIPAIGVMLGSYFTVDVISSALRWWDGVAATLLVVAIAIFVGVRLFRAVAGVDPLTALLSSVPGGAAEMTMLAEHYGVNTRIVAMSQTSRVAITAFCISIGLWISGYGGLALPSRSHYALGATDWAVLIACAFAGALAALRLRIPAGAMLGPLVLSAAAHASGMTDAVPPTIVVNLAQIALGASLGVQFSHIRDINAGRIVAASLVNTLFLLATGVMVAALCSALSIRDFAPIFLGTAPGGLSEMAVITVALGVEVAFVTTCHVTRLFLIIAVSPLIASRWHRRATRS
jgi:membrane AbrB-like protein